MPAHAPPRLHNKSTHRQYHARAHLVFPQQERTEGRFLARIATIDPVPLAAGSVAQVHRATLVDGREIVLKVQRPGSRLEIELDELLISLWARTTQWLVPSLRPLDLVGVVDEFGVMLRSQLDFRSEAAHNRRFARNFARLPGVRVPRLEDDMVTERVLGMEYIRIHGEAAGAPAAAAAAREGEAGTGGGGGDGSICGCGRCRREQASRGAAPRRAVAVRRAYVPTQPLEPRACVAAMVHVSHRFDIGKEECALLQVVCRSMTVACCRIWSRMWRCIEHHCTCCSLATQPKQ